MQDFVVTLGMCVLVWLLGLLVVWAAPDHVPFTLVVWLGFPCGLALVIAVTLLLISTGLPYGPGMVLSLCAAGLVAAAVTVCVHGRKAGPFRTYRTALLSCMAGMIACLLVDLSVFTNDSYMYVDLGRMMMSIPSLHEFEDIASFFLKDKLTSMGPFMWILHGMASHLGVTYAYWAHTFLSICFVGFLGNLLWKRDLPMVKKAGLIALATLLLSTYMVVYGSSALLPNMPYGVYFAMSVLTARQALIEKRTGYLVASLICLTASTLLRQESFLATFFFMLFLLQDPWARGSRLLWGAQTVMVVIVGGWYLRVALIIGPGFHSHFLTAERIVLVLCILGSLPLVQALSWRSRTVAACLPYGGVLALCGASLMVLGFTLVRPSHGVVCTIMLVKNMLSGKGLWGTGWATVALSALVLFRVRVPDRDLLRGTVGSFFIVVMLLGFFRVPWAYRWTDSANRMFLHIFPLVIAWLGLKICHAGEHADRTHIHGTTSSA